VLKLEHYRAGGKLITSRQALARFFAAQTEADTTTAAAPRTPTQRQRAAGNAARELEKLGA
jgi:hypothetical protein